MRIISVSLVWLIGNFSIATAHGQDDASHRNLSGDQDRLEQEYAAEIAILKSSALVRADAKLDLQEITGEKFRLDGKTFSFSDRDLIAVDQDLFEAQPMGKKALSDARVLVIKTNGKLNNAVMIDGDTGYTRELTLVADDVWATIDVDDIDEVKLAKFRHGDSDSKSATSGALNAHKNLRKRRKLQTSCSSFREIRISLHYDSGFCAMHNDDSAVAEAYLRQIVILASVAFEQVGICAKVVPCQVTGFCNGIDGDDELRDMVLEENVGFCEVRNGELTENFFFEYMFPNLNFPGSRMPAQCDVAHLIFGNNKKNAAPFPLNLMGFQTVGCASVGALCDPLSAGADYFAYTTSPILQAQTLAHELGHNANARHTAITNDLMAEILCPTCTLFSTQSMQVVDSYLDSVDDSDCLGVATAVVPTSSPSSLPSSLPSNFPSALPSTLPSSSPSNTPSASPSAAPVDVPSASPSDGPTVSVMPSSAPSAAPVLGPTAAPTLSSVPSMTPSGVPTVSSIPSSSPSSAPVGVPSAGPTVSQSPSASPSETPTISVAPSSAPSSSPSSSPSAIPSMSPSVNPTVSSIPSAVPSQSPSKSPTGSPTASPTGSPVSGTSDRGDADTSWDSSRSKRKSKNKSKKHSKSKSKSLSRSNWNSCSRLTKDCCDDMKGCTWASGVGVCRQATQSPQNKAADKSKAKKKSAQKKKPKLGKQPVRCAGRPKKACRKLRKICVWNSRSGCKSRFDDAPTVWANLINKKTKKGRKNKKKKN